MFRIAKNLVKTLEQSVLTLSQDTNQLDLFFQSIPPNLLLPQRHSQIQLEEGTDQQSQIAFDHRFNNVVSGLRVLCVDETQLQLQSFFDYIIGINDDAVPLISNQHGYFYPDYNKISQIFNAHCNQHLKLNVWSAKGGSFRDEYISVIAKDASQLDDVSLSLSKESEHIFQPLGFKVQWTSLVASTFTYHVLNINIPNGPAAQSGLIPDEDYIIGCQDGLLATGGEALLQDIVRSRANQDLILYVYNRVHDCVRPLTVQIGGDGRLGCNVGSGFLHRIPAVSTSHQQFDEHQAHLTEELYSPSPLDLQPATDSVFVPGNVITPVSHSTTAGASPPKKQAHRKKHVDPAVAATPMMNEYFSEGKDTSARAHSSTPDSTKLSQPPPPPTTTRRS